jgi:hypothetical protein
MSTESTVQDIITQSRAAASELVDEAIGFAEQAQTAASTSITGLPEVPSPREPSVDIPPFQPNQDLSADFTQAFDDALAEFGPDFQSEFTSFLNTYYPDFNDCLQHVEEWICDTIQNGGTGMPAAVEDAIWQRSRDREALEANRQKRELTRAWAGRGFSLPPGVLVEGLMTVDQDLANKVSTHSRDVAIKQAEIEIENIRFAVQQGVQLRLGVMSAALDYMRAFMQPWQMAIDKAAALVDAKSRLWQSSAAYYNALIAAEELQLKYDQISVERGLGLGKLSVEQTIAIVEARVNAAIASAEALGSAASAALSAQVSLGQLAYQEISEA